MRRREQQYRAKLSKKDKRSLEHLTSNPTIKRIRKAYVKEGLKAALEDAKRSGQPSIFMGKRGRRKRP